MESLKRPQPPFISAQINPPEFMVIEVPICPFDQIVPELPVDNVLEKLPQ